MTIKKKSINKEPRSCHGTWFSNYRQASIGNFIKKYLVILPVVASLMGVSSYYLYSQIENNPEFISKIENFVQENKEKLIEHLEEKIESGEEKDIEKDQEQIKEMYSQRNLDKEQVQNNMGQNISGSDILEQMVDKLKSDEGFSSLMYYDTENVPTIGYGFNLTENFFKNYFGDDYLAYLKRQKRLSREEAEEILRYYIKTVVMDEVVSSVPNFYEQPEDVQKIILNMHFNMGKSSFDSFTEFRKALANFDYYRAAEEMKNSDWYSEVKSRSRDLTEQMKQIALRYN